MSTYTPETLRELGTALASKAIRFRWNERTIALVKYIQRIREDGYVDVAEELKRLVDQRPCCTQCGGKLHHRMNNDMYCVGCQRVIPFTQWETEADAALAKVLGEG